MVNIFPKIGGTNSHNDNTKSNISLMSTTEMEKLDNNSIELYGATNIFIKFAIRIAPR
jgi:hypothetical protein